MLREAARAGDLTVGIDTFHRVSEDQARQHLGLPAGATEVQFLHGRSAEFDESRLLATLAGPARFVSIDGSHMLEDVRHDLSVCDAILSPSGIIACDDFLNPVRLGVGQAIHEHLSQGTTLAPFAYIQNKLFLCRRSLHADLLQLCHILCAADASGGGALYARNAQAKNGRNETQLYG
jgi:hypothetical protein